MENIMAKRKGNRLTINGQQANFLLFALDSYCKTDSRGDVQLVHGSCLDIQALRDALFAVHEHEETEERF